MQLVLYKQALLFYFFTIDFPQFPLLSSIYNYLARMRIRTIVVGLAALGFPIISAQDLAASEALFNNGLPACSVRTATCQAKRLETEREADWETAVFVFGSCVRSQWLR